MTRLTTLIASLNGGIIIETPQRKVLQVNQTFCDMFAIPASPDALRGTGCADAGQQVKGLFRDPEGFVRRIEAILAEGRIVLNDELELVDGRIFERDYVPISVTDGDVEHLWHYRDVTEKQRLVAERDKSLDQYRELIASLDSIIWEADPDTFAFTFVSPQSMDILGYPPTRWTDDPEFWLTHLHPEDREWVPAYCRKATREGRNHTLEYRMIAADGRVVWLKDVVSVIEEGGRPAKLRGLMVDITGQKETSLALHQSRKDLELFFAQSLNGFFFMTADEPFRWDDSVDKDAVLEWALDHHRIARINDAMLAQYGADREAYEGHTGGDFFATDREYGKRLWRDLFDNGHQSMETLERRADGTPIWLEGDYICMYDEQGRITGHFGIQREITARKAAEAALKKTRQELELFFAQSLDGFFFMMLDEPVQWDDSVDKEALLDYVFAHQRVTRANEAILAQYGARRDDYLGLTPNDFFAHDIARGRQLWRTLFDQGRLHIDTDERRVDGTPIWVEGDYICLYDEAGRITGHFGIQRDVTEQRGMEERLRQAQKMEAVGLLAGGIAHEFNNTLAVITGYSDMLLADNLETDVREPVEQILNAGLRATRMTAELLAFSRKQVFQPASVHLNSLVTTQVKLLGRLLGEHIEIVSLLNPDLPAIQADAGQIEQMLMNIAINARDAMPGGGKLTIFTRTVDGIPDGTAPGPFVCLGIRDTGIGMDAATRERIFEPFFTTKAVDKGTGLGLATVYGLIEQNRGHIRVESTPGEGALFELFFPPAERNGRPMQQTQSTASAARGSETILLVEDEPAVRQFTRTALNRYGYTVLTAANGDEGMRLFETHAGAIDLVLTDVVMPLKSGPELVRELRSIRRDLKVVIFSGYADNLVDIPEDAHTRVLEKPFSHADLARCVRQLLD